MRLLSFPKIFWALLAFSFIFSLSDVMALANDSEERRVAVVAGLPDSQKGWPGYLRSLTDLMSSKLSVQTRLVFNPLADGILAANRLSLANLDGSLLGVLPMVAMATRVAEDRTPYVLDDFEPLLLAETVPFALLAGPKAPFNNLSSLKAFAKSGQITFWRAGLDPIALGDLLAYGLFRDLGLKPNLVFKATLDPKFLAQDPTALMVKPLDELDLGLNHYKIVAVLTDVYAGPCAPAGLDLRSQNYLSQVHDYMGFYYPKGTILEVTDKTTAALITALTEPSALELASKNCLATGPKGPVAFSSHRAAEFLAQEIDAQRQLIESLRP
ncbi:MAG: tripartite tricarboxylate transporter substrate binding protein [Deltaproteobacteria bacterium]|nr:tripartite tricarboxylate transporter substrate binding protein [Deltaproteobacteria bacterium]